MQTIDFVIVATLVGIVCLVHYFKIKKMKNGKCGSDCGNCNNKSDCQK